MYPYFEDTSVHITYNYNIKIAPTVLNFHQTMNRKTKINDKTFNDQLISSAHGAYTERVRFRRSLTNCSTRISRASANMALRKLNHVSPCIETINLFSVADPGLLRWWGAANERVWGKNLLFGKISPKTA